jgi:Helix-turn-helix domain/PIF1-like helicase/HRDC domain
MDTANPELQLARDFVRYTSRNIFLTGKAGTGKTTFLHDLKQSAPKRMIVTAPTGVAAINAGGVTLHSFFQLPLGPFVPGGEARRQAEAHRLSRQKLDIIKSMDLLVIDEISMVRCDLLDAVDFVLRRHRGTDLPFGGVQLLMIGDLHQLSPVLRQEDWEVLKHYYDSGYFFSSAALRSTEVVSIELKHIYRQSDAEFIELLNQVRDSRMDAATLERLGSRYRPGFAPKESDGYITLTTHNRSADRINETRLRALAAKSFSFPARIEGDYPAHAYPTAETLTLKKGAQVMFVRNDTTEDKRWFNGKIGTVTRIDRERVLVKCAGEDAAIAVEPAIWENIKYSIDEQTKGIAAEVIGTFVQYPLRLAWAITIHKSQGLTFERAIIDAGAAFSPGQVYVALSRCRTFAGIVLSSPISPRVVKTDATVSRFVGEATRSPPTREQLDRARVSYQQRLLQECWDFRGLGARLGKLAGLLRTHRQILELRGAGSIDELERQTRDAVVAVGGKFQRQLQSLYREDRIPEEDGYLQERVRKASAYFTDQLQLGLVAWLRAFSFETDNKALRKTLRQTVEGLQQAVAIKTAGLESCREQFSASAYLSAVAQAEIDYQARVPLAEQGLEHRAADTEHPELLQALRQWRDRTASEEEAQGAARHKSLTRAVFRRIVATLPDGPEALAEIQGIGRRTVKRYGGELLAIVADYCQAHHIDPATLPRPARQRQGTARAGEKEGDTRLISYCLYQEGMRIEEIARRRSLKVSTIEGHLAHYIGAGQLPVTDFISEERIARIVAVLAEQGVESLTLVKEQLGDDYSYGEIKMVRAHLHRA